MKQSKSYQNIDMIQTGIQLKLYMDREGISVKDIQEYLYLSCPQPIYRWIHGKILPSVDHLLMLSELFGVHMEELLVKKQRILQTDFNTYNNMEFQKRITVYYRELVRTVA